MTLKKNDVAQFPDAVTERGQKHLEELTQLKKLGHRAIMLYIVQREDVARMRPAIEIDKKYAELLTLAHQSGVEIIVGQCKMGLDGLYFKQLLPLDLE